MKTTVRLAHANAITMMICALNDYFFEDRSIGDNNNLSSHDDLVSGVSKGSIADYICYSVYGSLRPVVVIIETKKKFTWPSY